MTNTATTHTIRPDADGRTHAFRVVGDTSRWLEAHAALADAMDIPLTAIHAVYADECGYRIPATMFATPRPIGRPDGPRPIPVTA